MVSRGRAGGLYGRFHGGEEKAGNGRFRDDRKDLVLSGLSFLGGFRFAGL